MIRKIARVVLPIFTLFLGIAVMVALVRTKPKAPKTPRDERGTVVEAVSLEASTKPVVVKAHGTVVPARSVVIAPEVQGRVTKTAASLVPGGRFVAGDIMLVLDGSDYRLALKAQNASVKQAETALALQERQKEIARIEWERMGKVGDPLTLQEQQVDSAKLAVEAAQSTRRRARLAINRTVVRAPFNAIVQDRKVDVGQIIGPQSPVITLAGTDEFWVQISVPVERLVWLDVPGVAGVTEGNGSKARVWREINGRRVEREGAVVRLLGDVDPMGRMARLLVSIKEPLVSRAPVPVVGENRPQPPELPLLLGSFVQVELMGKEVDGVVTVSREALRDGDSVYVMQPQKVDATERFRSRLVWASGAELDELTTLQVLDIRKVDVVWRQRDTVLVRARLQPGERIITSPVPAPIQGMKVRDPESNGNEDAARASTARDDEVRQQ